MGHQLKIFAFVLLGEFDFVAALFQFEILHLAEQVKRRIEVQFEIIVVVQIVLPYP